MKATTIQIGLGVLAYLILLIGYQQLKNELEQTQEELLKYKVHYEHIPGGNISNEFDSLTSELFNAQTELGRHQLTRDEILKKYPEVNKEYTFFYEHQTE